MKTFSKLFFGAALVAGAATFATGPAAAQVSVGIGIGGPGYYGGYYGPRYYGPRYYGSYSCDPYSRFYDPDYCDDYGDYGYGFGNIIYFDNGWWRGPFRTRYWHGENWYWVNNGWRRNEWRGRGYPRDITFRNGGSYRHGRFEGFRGADRFRTRGDYRANWSGHRAVGDHRFNGGDLRGGSMNTRAQFDSRSYQGRSNTGAVSRGDRGGHSDGGHSGGGRSDGGGHHGR